MTGIKDIRLTICSYFPMSVHEPLITVTKLQDARTFELPGEIQTRGILVDVLRCRIILPYNETQYKIVGELLGQYWHCVDRK